MGQSLRKRLRRAAETSREKVDKAEKADEAAEAKEPQPAPYRDGRRKSSAQWAAVMSRSLKKKLGQVDPAPAPPPPVAPPAPVKAEEDSSENRRINERITYGHEVQWLAGKDRFSGEVLDISESGLRLTCDKAVNVHTQVRVFIPLPAAGHTTRQMYLLEGVVVRAGDGEVGIFFIDLPLDVRVLIRDLVDNI